MITEDPEKAFKSPLEVVLKEVSAIPGLHHARDFFEGVRDWEKIETHPERVTDVFYFGIKALEAIERWWRKEAIDNVEKSVEDE